MGRPTKYTSEVADKIVEAVREGCNRRDAARVVGVDESTLYRWMQDNEEFRSRLHDADAEIITKLEKTVIRAAITDWKPALAALQAKRQKEWGRNSKVQVGNADGKPFSTISFDKLTPEQIAAIAAVEIDGTEENSEEE